MTGDTTTTASPILLEVEGHVARLTLNQPPLNIVDMPMLDALAAALDELPARGDIRVLVLTATGTKAFSAGADVRAHMPDQVAEMLHRFHYVVRRLRGLSCTTLAAVRGLALGGGCELALACDLILADTTAKFGQPEINLGCYPPAACVLLPELVGPRRAYEMVVLGKSFKAEDAERIGLVNRVAAPDALDEEVRQWCSDIASRSPVVVRLTREALRRPPDLEFSGALDRVERIYLDRLMKTADAVEGIQSFLDKRPPVWKGE